MRIKSVYFVILTAILFGSLNSNCYSQDNDLLKQGIYDFRQENYDEAIDVFTEVLKKDPKSSLASYYMGLTYKKMEDYIAAKKYLENSLNLKPKIKGALMELIDLLYRLGEYEEAKKWIAIAEEEGIRPAQAKFLKGLTYQKSGDYEEAVEAFKEAEDLDDKLVQPAEYQIAVCYLKMKKFSEAKNAFKEVFAIDPYSDMADQANQYIDALDKKIKQQKPFHISGKFGYEYDSNVLLKPTSSELVSDIAEEADTRQVFDLNADYTFRNEENTRTLKLGYGFHMAKQNDFGRYDIIGNNFSAQGNLVFDKLLMTFPLNYNHTIVDENNYVHSVTAGHISSLMVGKSQMGQLGGLYSYTEFLRPTNSPNESRTGHKFTGIAGWFWFFSGNKGFFNVKYNITKDMTNGTNWENLSHKFTAGFLYPFWDKFKFTGNASIDIDFYDNTHSVYGKKREDQTYALGTGLSYEIIENAELGLNYTYVKQQSNISVNKYDRHVVGATCSYKI